MLTKIDKDDIIKKYHAKEDIKSYHKDKLVIKINLKNKHEITNFFMPQNHKKNFFKKILKKY